MKRMTEDDTEIQTMDVYMVYGKHKVNEASNRFHPFDMQNNKFVINLLYASMFTEEELPELNKEIKAMNQLNEDYIFEVRKK